MEAEFNFPHLYGGSNGMAEIEWLGSDVIVKFSLETSETTHTFSTNHIYRKSIKEF